MLLKAFIKPNFISFYYEEEKYKLLNEQYKNNKIIFSETKEFENIKELKQYINEIVDDNPQTYISTFITSPNQGVVPSCNKHTYKELGIEFDNIKMICIKNSYSFYTTIYEILEIKKEYPFIDFLYPAFAIIDKKAVSKINTLYILTTKENIYTLIYQNTPVFGDIFLVTEEEEIEETEDISDIDLVDDFDDSLDEDIENIDEEEIEKEESDIKNFDIEYKVIENIKITLKEYYENGGDFIEKIIILDTVELKNTIIETINDELFIESTINKIDILKTLNEISRENV